MSDAIPSELDQSAVQPSCSRDRFQQSASDELATGLTFARSTTLLEQLDRFAGQAALELRPDHRIDTARNRGDDLPVVIAALESEVVGLEVLADRIRTARRSAIHAAIERLRPGSIPEFVDAIVLPLLARGLLPRVAFSGTDSSNRIARVRQRDLLAIRERLIITAESASQPILAMVALLAERDSAPIFHETASYLQMAEHMDRTFVRHGREMVSVEVLFGSGQQTWRPGHLLQTMIVPRPVSATSELGRASLHPAYAAVRSLLRDDPLPAIKSGEVWDLAVGDYAGGSEPYPAGGPSAGLALALTLIGSTAAFPRRPGVLATGRVTPQGHLQSLSGDGASHAQAALAAKGACVARIAERPCVLLAHMHDAAAFVSGAPELPIRTTVIPDLCSGVELMFDPPWRTEARPGGRLDSADEQTVRAMYSYLSENPQQRVVFVAPRSVGWSWERQLECAISSAAGAVTSYRENAVTIWRSAVSGHASLASLAERRLSGGGSEVIRSARNRWIAERLREGTIWVLLDGLLRNDARGVPRMGRNPMQAMNLLLRALDTEVATMVAFADDRMPDWAVDAMLAYGFVTVSIPDARAQSKGESVWSQ